MLMKFAGFGELRHREGFITMFIETLYYVYTIAKQFKDHIISIQVLRYQRVDNFAWFISLDLEFKITIVLK